MARRMLSKIKDDSNGCTVTGDLTVKGKVIQANQKDINVYYDEPNQALVINNLGN
jgi:hypothetical protein